jgi:hypothetical protein
LAIAASLLSACIVEVPSGQLPPSLDDRQPVFTQGTSGRNPIIQSFTANPSNVTKGQPITFQVVAIDPERNPLQLNWAATDGTLSTNTGQVVSWIPPEKPGVYSVTVTVANGRGGFVTGTQNLTVQANGSAVIGGKPASPTPPVPVLSPSPLPSVVPSALPSVGFTPIASAWPSTAPDTSPDPSPSPVASAKPYVQLDFTSQEARFDVQSNRVLSQLDSVHLKVVSASGAEYVAILSEVTPTPAGFYDSFDIRADGTGSTKMVYPGVHILYFVRADRTIADSPGGPDKVRLKDGAIGAVGLYLQAARMDRANVRIPDGAWVGRDLNGCVFAFKFDGGQLDLGTFKLP